MLTVLLLLPVFFSFQGGATNNHEGNVQFRAIVQAHQNEYLHAAKSEKKEVAQKCVRIVRSKGGGFLKKCSDGRVGWTDIGDTKAREKTSQSLREGLDILRKDLEQQNQGRAATTGLSASEVTTTAGVATADHDATSSEAAVADAKRKAEDDASDDGNNKKKAARTSPAVATFPGTSTATNADMAAAVEAAMLAAPISTTNRTPPTLADATKADLTATAGDSRKTDSFPGAPTEPKLVAESALIYNVPVPAPAPSYFDYSASFALSTSAGTSGVSASAFNYPGTSSFGGYGYPYPYPFPGYHPPAGNGYANYGLGYEANNLYASAAASFGIPAPPVTTPVDNDDAEEEEQEIFGEVAQI